MIRMLHEFSSIHINSGLNINYDFIEKPLVYLKVDSYYHSYCIIIIINVIT